jgi:hypothetical protein
MDRKTKRKIGASIAIVSALIAMILVMIWYFQKRYKTILVAGTADGGTITLTCASGQVIKVVAATYTQSGSKVRPTKVTHKLQSALDALNGAAYTVISANLLDGPSMPGTLDFRYKCVGAPTQSGFRISRSPGGNRRISRQRIEFPRARSPRPEIDSDFTSDGVYEGIVHESLVSRPRARQNKLTASHTGGGIGRDPRFEYAHPGHTADGTNWAHGAHAGAPFMGSFGNHEFRPPNQWRHASGMAGPA